MPGPVLSPECFLSEEAGFLPLEAPLVALPPAYGAWDAMAAELPTCVANLRVAEALSELPSSAVDGLPTSALCRAASLLGLFVHACVREQQMLRAAPRLPEALQRAWEEVCGRLGRPGAGLTYSDLILYNWRLRDRHGPRLVENMDVMTPVFGSEEERRFYLVMAESHAVATPLVGAVSALERATTTGAIGEIEAVFDRIRSVLDRLAFDTLLKIDPNPYSPSFVDHLVWSKTVAPFAYPVRHGELGLSGGGSPIFHVLDALFGRSAWRSSIGAELTALRDWMPAPMLAFIDRAAALNLPAYVKERPLLHAAYHQLREAYVGQRGWLGLHRLKVYGFMEVAFKAGRTQTNGGFSGRAADRAWEALDDELEVARQERGPQTRCPMARPVAVRPAAQAPVFQVDLDTPLRTHPGDRLGVWPRNTPTLVDRTLQGLRATGSEPLRMTTEWRAALAKLLDEVPPDSVPLRTFLTFAQLRPVSRAAAKRLLGLVFIPALHDMLEQRHEDQFELWDVLELMARHNYDTRRLWLAAPWHAESIARILPAERPRIYSVSSATGPGVTLTVGQLSFVSRQLDTESDVSRQGTGSRFLTTTSETFPADVIRPSRFALPARTTPVVMFAAGSGISPFRGFWQARRRAPSLTWLLATVRDEPSLPYADELTAEVASGLEVHVTCSRDDVELVGVNGRFVRRPAARGYVDRAISVHADRLWHLLEPVSRGGAGASFYVCGQTRLAQTVLTALETIVASKLRVARDSSAVREFFRRLAAEGRLMSDVFTTFAPRDAPSVLPYATLEASDLIQHNNDEMGYWCAISGLVYDVTEFQWRHPGGARLLRLNAGIDATRSYEKVNHHLNAEVEASLDLYKIGKIRRLAFGSRRGATLLPEAAGDRPATATARADGLLHFTLQDLYRHWIRYVFQVVEIENSFAGNRDLGRSPRLVSTPPGSRLHRWFDLEVLRVFGDMSLEQLMGPVLNRLWHLQVGMCSPDQPLGALEQELSALRSRARALFTREVERCCTELRADTPGLPHRLDAALSLTARWLASLKGTLREAIRLFEWHEVRVVEAAGGRLTATLAELPARMTTYVEGLEAILQADAPQGQLGVSPRGDAGGVK